MALDRESMRAYIDNYRKERRKAAVEQLGGMCARCGSADQLEFDHIDPASKTVTIASMFTAAKAKFDEELAKCQLLCRPCHVDKSRAEGSFGQWEHGTFYAYTKHKCRCEPCRDAKRRSKRAYLERKKQRAGVRAAKEADCKSVTTETP